MIRYTTPMHKRTLYVLFAVGIAVGVIATVPLYMDYTTNDYVFETVEDVPVATVAIVLGASVVRGEPSPILHERAEVALALYQAGKVQKILVTGDDSVPGFDEVTPVRRYLEDEGVPGEDIFLDHVGFDTYSSMYRARDVFAVTDVIIVTQAFHLPRAVFIARELGLSARGVVAEQRGNAFFNYMREVPASVKAAGDLLFRRVPKYLGEQYPITGNGTETWE